MIPGATKASLLAAAKSELSTAEAKGPDLVADRQISQAQLDRMLEGWRAIVALLDAGKCDNADLAWADLVEVARANWERRRDAIDANQDPARHAALQARGEAVVRILRYLEIQQRLARLPEDERPEAALRWLGAELVKAA